MNVSIGTNITVSRMSKKKERDREQLGFLFLVCPEALLQKRKKGHDFLEVTLEMMVSSGSQKYTLEGCNTFSNGRFPVVLSSEIKIKHYFFRCFCIKIVAWNSRNPNLFALNHCKCHLNFLVLNS